MEDALYYWKDKMTKEEFCNLSQWVLEDKIDSYIKNRKDKEYNMITQHDFKLLNYLTKELIEFIYDNEESFKYTFCAPENSQIRGVHLAGTHLCISLISLEYITTEVYIDMIDVSEWYEKLNK